MSTSYCKILLQFAFWSILIFSTYGCAIHYYEEKTGVEHIWGFGHMKMKAGKPNEGLQAIVHGTDLIGVSLGKADKHGYFTVGWQRLEFIDVLKESTSIRLEWPDNSFANVRVGSEFPLENIQKKEGQIKNEAITQTLNVELKP